MASRPVMKSKDQIKYDSNMHYALSLMTRCDKASSSLIDGSNIGFLVLGVPGN
jgi:hypothetical protein